MTNKLVEQNNGNAIKSGNIKLTILVFIELFTPDRYDWLTANYETLYDLCVHVSKWGKYWVTIA